MESKLAFFLIANKSTIFKKELFFHNAFERKVGINIINHLIVLKTSC